MRLGRWYQGRVSLYLRSGQTIEFEGKVAAFNGTYEVESDELLTLPPFAEVAAIRVLDAVETSPDDTEAT